MAGIELNQSYVKGLVPILKNPNILEPLHAQAESNNSALHLPHAALVGTLEINSSYELPVIDAINTGAMVYEALVAGATTDYIPPNFIIPLIEERNKNPNICLDIADQMTQERQRLSDTDELLAHVLYELCEAQVKDPSLTLYGVGSAALMWAVHGEIDVMWRLYMIQRGDDLNLEELMDLSN